MSFRNFIELGSVYKEVDSCERTGDLGLKVERKRVEVYNTEWESVEFEIYGF